MTQFDEHKEPPAKKCKTDEPLTPKSIQLTLMNANDKDEESIKWPDDHPSVQRIQKAIMDLIVVDMLPYSIVEGDDSRLLNFADPCAWYSPFVTMA